MRSRRNSSIRVDLDLGLFHFHFVVVAIGGLSVLVEVFHHNVSVVRAGADQAEEDGEDDQALKKIAWEKGQSRKKSDFWFSATEEDRKDFRYFRYFLVRIT